MDIFGGYSVKDVADDFQVTPSTIFRWTHQGYNPHVKMDNQARFRLSQVDRRLEKRPVEGRKSINIEVLWDEGSARPASLSPPTPLVLANTVP